MNMDKSSKKYVIATTLIGVVMLVSAKLISDGGKDKIREKINDILEDENCTGLLMKREEGEINIYPLHRW